MNIGIYKIQNITDNKVYIGSSVDIKSRQYKHFWMLTLGSHYNSHLQSSYNKFGKDSFIFEILELCNPEYLVSLENKYIDFYNSIDSTYGYNQAKVNEFRRNTFNADVKLKLSKYNLNKNKNFSTYSLKNINTGEIFIFDSLVGGADYLINNGFTKGNPRNVRMKISNSLRGKLVNNGYKGSIRKTCYKHEFKIIN